MTNYFRVPFALSGTKSSIPEDPQVGGEVSYTDGYGPDYQKEIGTDPDALAIERDKFNELMNRITTELQKFQQFSFPDFITSAENNGTAFSYAKDVIVRYSPDGGSTYNFYQSKVNNNTNLPTSTAHWNVFSIPTPPESVKVAQLTYQVASGASAGSYAGGTYSPIALNTKNFDPDNIVTLKSNGIFSLGAGTYRVTAENSAYGTNTGSVTRFTSRISNITDSTVIKRGGVTYSGPGNNGSGGGGNIVIATFTISGTKDIQAQIYGNIAFGAGLAMGTGENEVYNTVTIEKYP